MNRARRILALALLAPAAACTAILGATDVPDQADSGPTKDATTPPDSASNDSAASESGNVDAGGPDASTPVEGGGACTGGALQCSGLQPQVCADGGWQNSGGACPYACDAGVCAVTYAGEVLAEHPLGYWRLSDPDGSLAVDQVGTAYPGNDPGTYHGDVLYGQPGAILTDPSNKSVYLDFHDPTGGHVSVTSTFETVSQFPGQQPYTLEVWIQPTTIDTSYRGVLSNAIEAGVGKEGYVLYLGGFSNAGIGFDRFQIGSSTPVRDASAVAVNTGWHYVVVTYGGAQDGTIDLYVDGQIAAHAATPLLGQSFSGCSFDIGSSLCGTGSTFRGFIDEVAVYPVALDAGTIQAHYAKATQ